jgi:hypothetical protein
LSTSFQAIWARAAGSPGALLVSPFNVKWKLSALARGVEESKFCLFSVILPAKCVSIVSPRFHYRRLAFCFLPLVAILESSAKAILNEIFIPVNTYIKKKKPETKNRNSQITSETLHLRELEETNLQVNMRKDILQITVERNEGLENNRID